MVPVDTLIRLNNARYMNLASFEPDDPGLAPGVEQEDEQVFAFYQEQESENVK